MADNNNCRCCAFITGIFLVATSALVILTIGILVVRPYLETNTFKDTTCIVSGQQDLGPMKCECGRGCLSSILCMKIFVDYFTKTGNTIKNAVLYENVYALPYDQLTRKDRYPGATNCTFRRCREDVEANIQEVEKFLREYGRINTTLSCFYNMANRQETVLVITSNVQVIVGLAFPSVGLLAGLALFLFYFCWRERTRGLVLSTN